MHIQPNFQALETEPPLGEPKEGRTHGASLGLSGDKQSPAAPRKEGKEASDFLVWKREQPSDLTTAANEKKLTSLRNPLLRESMCASPRKMPHFRRTLLQC